MIGWDMLKPIQAPQGAIATAPASPLGGSAPTGGGLDSLAGGIQSGLMQGQQMGLNKQQGQINDQTIQANDIKLQGAKQDWADSQTLRAAAKQGEDAYIKEQMTIDPAKGQAYLLSKANVKFTLASAGLAEEQTKGAGLDNYTKAIQAAGQVVHAAMGGKTPEMQQKIYSYGMSLLPEKTRALFPKQYDENTAVAVHTLAMDNLATNAEIEQAKKGPPGTVKLQDEVDRLTQNIETNKAKGVDTSRLEQRKAELQKQVDASGRGTSANPLDTELAKTDAGLVKDAAELRTNMETFHVDAQAALKQIPNVPTFALGPIAKGIKLDKLNPEAQKLISPLNAMALQLKEYYKLGSGQGFTDADRDFLTEIAGNTGYYKYSLPTIVKRMDSIAGAARYNAWKKEAGIRKRSSTYDAWLAENPEPAKTWENTSSQPVTNNQITPEMARAELARRRGSK